MVCIFGFFSLFLWSHVLLMTCFFSEQKYSFFVMLLLTCPLTVPAFQDCPERSAAGNEHKDSHVYSYLYHCGRGEISLGEKPPNQVVLKDSF